MPLRVLRSHRSALLACGGLLLLFTTLAWFAAATKSPVYDEPYHAIGSWLQLRFFDFRFDNENPPLWEYWAGLPNSQHALSVNFEDPMWKAMPRESPYQWFFGVNTLYRTPGNDPVKFINHCRGMMLILGLLLGVLICVWSWRIAGPVAAIISTFLFCLDPNFLAHSSLMKNDVAFAMSMFALVMALWKAGKNLSATSVVWVALLSIANLTVKFSGVVTVLCVPLLLCTRALLPMDWPVLGQLTTTRFKRLRVAAAFTLLVAVISWIGIWAVYGFRFAPTPEKNLWLDLQPMYEKVRHNQMIVHPHSQPADALPLAAQAVKFANQHGLFPQAFLAGFLFTYTNSLVRCSYLCGQISYTGWWWYFPFAMWVKTPVATLLAGLGAVWIILRGTRTGRFKNHSLQWTAICLALPAALFLASAMSSHLNIGIRHVLPIYPLVFVVIGCVGASVWQSRQGKPRWIMMGLAIVLATESLTAYPDYIPFFNFPAAHLPGGKSALLGDSNLDWGQDLPLLVDWQHAHPNETLYLSYFGYADPQYFGLKYISLPGGYFYDLHHQWVDPYAHSYVAISVSTLQGLLLDEPLTAYYAQWRKQKPIAVFGDSICLFEYNPAMNLKANP